MVMGKFNLKIQDKIKAALQSAKLNFPNYNESKVGIECVYWADGDFHINVFSTNILFKFFPFSFWKTLRHSIDYHSSSKEFKYMLWEVTGSRAKILTEMVCASQADYDKDDKERRLEAKKGNHCTLKSTL